MTALANPTLWRTHPQKANVRVWIDEPAVKFKARVNQSVFPYPAGPVLFDTVTVGAYTDIEVGMTVLFGTSDGADDLGRTYIRLAATSSSITVSRAEQGDNDGEVNLADNAYITVLDDFRLWAKIPSISSGSGVRLTDGYRAFATYKKLPPVIILNCGLGVQADVNPATGKATFAFVASSSYAAEPGATISSYAYTLPSGATVVSGSISTHTVTFTMSQGVKWLKLVVTDSNGTTQTRRVRLIAENDSNIDGWELQPYDIGDDGQAIMLKLLSPLSRVTAPEGTGIYVWQRERYGATVGSLAGPAGSQHMLFTGWLDTESSNSNATVRGMLNDTTLKAIDFAGRAKQLMIVPISTGNDSAADSWDEMVDANIDKLMIRTAHEYSTLLTLCDFTWSGTGASYAFPRWDSSGGTLWDVLSGYARAKGGRYVLTCDEWSRIADKLDPLLVESRTSNVIVDLNETDWSSIKAGRDRAAKFRFLWGKSTVPSSAQAADTKTVVSANAVAPGLSGGMGPTERTKSGFLATSTDLVELIKNLYARMTAPNNDFVIDLAHGGNAGISPAAKEWVRVTQSAAKAAQRGWTWTSARMLPLKVRVSYDAKKGLMTRSLTVERETVGVAAVAFTPKQQIENSIPYIPPPGLDLPLPIAPVSSPIPGQAGTGTVAYFNSDDYVYITSDHSTPAALGGPTYTRYNLGLGTIRAFIIDPFSPLYLGTGSTVNGWLIAGTSTAAIYRIADIFGARTTTSRISLGTVGDGGYVLEVSRGIQNFVAAASYMRTVGTKVYSTSDDSTWTAHTISSFYNTTAGYEGAPGLFVSNYTAGLLYVGAFTANGAAGLATAKLFVSADYGATTTTSGTPQTPTLYGHAPAALHVPYANNASEHMVYYSGYNSPTAYGNLYRIESNGTTSTLITDAGSGIQDTGGAGFRGVIDGDNAPAFIIMSSRYDAPGSPSANYGLFKSSDGGNTFSTVYALGSITPVGIWLAGDNPNIVYLLGGNLIDYSSDFLTTVESKLGNIPALYGAVGGFVGLCGGPTT